MTPLVPITMFGWVGVALILFACLPARRAMITSFVIAWLFLPMYTYELPGPDYNKAMAACGSALLAMMIFDSRKLLSLSFCPSWADVPMLAWCLCPIATSIANAPDLKLYDGLSAAFENIVVWGLPYFIGRVYLGHLTGLRDLAVGLFSGGLLYMPLCLIEMRFSPQLHRWIYGFHQHDFEQSVRDGGYRPMVFMEHGLAVALFMTTASLAGFWLWKTGVLRRMMGVPVLSLLLPLIATTVLLRSTAALIFFMAGVATLMAGAMLRTRVLLVGLLIIPTAYVTARIAGRWDAQNIMDAVVRYTGPDRAQSFQFRIQNERMIADRANRQPAFGWGLYGRAYVKDGDGNIVSVPDSLWIIALGQMGLVGLISLLAMMVPVGVVLLRLPRNGWNEGVYSGVIVFSVLLALYALDNLLNNMPNPLFLLALGGVSGIAAAKPFAGFARGVYARHSTGRTWPADASWAHLN